MKKKILYFKPYFQALKPTHSVTGLRFQASFQLETIKIHQLFAFKLIGFKVTVISFKVEGNFHTKYLHCKFFLQRVQSTVPFALHHTLILPYVDIICLAVNHPLPSKLIKYFFPSISINPHCLLPNIFCCLVPPLHFSSST